MMGLVFREFLDHVDRTHGANVTEEVIDAAELPSGGAYAATGYYPFEELQSLIAAASRLSGQRPSGLIEGLGHSIGCSFARGYRRYFDAYADLFDLLAHLDERIHVEVRKLYPHAELPRFEMLSRSEERMVLAYRSERRLHDLARGVIEAAAAHYGERVSVLVEVIDEADWRAVITVDRIGARR